MCQTRKDEREMEMVSRNAVWREKRRKLLALPRYTLGEEIANAITHGLGAALAAVGAGILLVHTHSDPLSLISAGIYSATMFLLYLVSTLYHSLAVSRTKKVFQVLDHCTIYLLIAGTYTPISLLCIGGNTGWLLVGIVWTAAVVGIVLNAVNMRRFRVISMVCYLAMGWCVLFFLPALLRGIDSVSLILLVTGGVLYTVGAVIYGLGRTVPYMHALWHVFCTAGSIFHYLVVYRICG